MMLSAVTQNAFTISVFLVAIIPPYPHSIPTTDV